VISLAQLWLPVVLAAVLIFVASSLIHMVFKWHNREYRPLSNEEAVRAAIRAGAPAPGQYALPHVVDMKDMKLPQVQQKFSEGPVAFLTVRPSGAIKMGKPLVLWFVYTLVVTLIAAYVAAKSLPAQASAAQILRVTSLIPFLAYVGGSIQHGIWMGKPWSSVAKEVLDGAIYAAITSLTLLSLWPR
jgi:hypothetical protein